MATTILDTKRVPTANSNGGYLMLEDAVTCTVTCAEIRAATGTVRRGLRCFVGCGRDRHLFDVGGIETELMWVG